MSNVKRWLVLVPIKKMMKRYTGKDSPPDLNRYNYHLIEAESARQAWEETKTKAGFNSCEFYLLG